MIERSSANAVDHQARTAQGLTDWFEGAIHDGVESVLREGLAEACAGPAVRAEVEERWRDRLAFIAAEALADRLSARGARADNAHLDRAVLRRTLRAYAPLVAAEARLLSRSAAQPAEFAAD